MTSRFRFVILLLSAVLLFSAFVFVFNVLLATDRRTTAKANSHNNGALSKSRDILKKFLRETENVGLSAATVSAAIKDLKSHFLEIQKLISTSEGDDILNRSLDPPKFSDEKSMIQILIKQRNDLSQNANLLMQRFMQFQCNIIDSEKQKKREEFEKLNSLSIKEDASERMFSQHPQLNGNQLLLNISGFYDYVTDRERSVSSTGAWCRDAGAGNSSQHATDKHLASFLARFFKGKKVGSFGDGPGVYKQLLDSSHLLVSYTAYDGAPFAAETSGGRVQHLDLTLSAFGIPVFDWILSLEVAEHIPFQFESTFLDNVVRHAKEGVVLSWAAIGQGGLSHVNNRPINYVVKKMAELGFELDTQASRDVREACYLSWLKSNTNVYRRRLDAPVDPHMA